MTLRAVIWCAVSTKTQSGEDKYSLPQQEADGVALCEENGWNVVDVLTVPGHSRRGRDLHEVARKMERKGIHAFMRLIELWDRRAFDVLIVRDGDRFARSQSLFARVVEETILGAQARIFSLTDGMIDEHNFRMWIAMCGYKSASHIDGLVEARHSGMEKRVKMGLNSHRVPLGFTLKLKDHSREPEALIHASEQRSLIQDMATLLLDRVGWGRFGEELYQRYGHVNPLTGQPYTSRTFYTFFHNPFTWGHTAYGYAGKQGLWAFDETEATPDGVTMHRNLHQPLYTGELAEQVKAELRRRDAAKGRASTNRSYFFTGLLICGTCGNSLTIQARQHYYRDGEKRPLRHHYNQWYCNHARKFKDCPERRIVPDTIVKTYVNSLLTEIRKKRSLAILRTGQPVLSGDVEKLRRDIADLEKQIDVMILRESQAPDSTRDRYTRQIEQAGERLEILRRNLAETRIHQPEIERQRLQDSALAQLGEITLAQFWALPPKEVNRRLHHLLGDVRLVASQGQIVELRRVGM